MDYSPYVPLPNLIYVLVADRAIFDKIERPISTETERVLVKVVEEAGTRVMFQHWLPESFASAMTPAI